MDNKSFEIEYDESTWSYDETGILETVNVYINNEKTTVNVKHDDYGAYVMNGSKKIYVLELNSDGYKDLLIKRISNDTIVNIEHFLGYPISEDIVESGLENEIRMTLEMMLDQMPNEEYRKWESKYLFDMPEATE